MKLIENNINQTGLERSDWLEILEFCKNIDGLEKVILFGSRAMGNYKPGSDVDLALVGRLERDSVLGLSGTLNDESSMPQKFDVVDYHKISNPDFKTHIVQYGKVVIE